MPLNNRKSSSLLSDSVNVVSNILYLAVDITMPIFKRVNL